MGKACCFIGHRKIDETKDLREKIRQTVTDLIREGVDTFIFGSRSDFDYICHTTVTEVKESCYHDIIRKRYTCKSEVCALEKERSYWEKIIGSIKKNSTTLLYVEEEVEHKKKFKSQRGSYVERNEAMIDDSDICVFYCDNNYLPPRIKTSRAFNYQPNSGTQVAYKYAVKKKKRIINLYFP